MYPYNNDQEEKVIKSSIPYRIGDKVLDSVSEVAQAALLSLNLSAARNTLLLLVVRLPT